MGFSSEEEEEIRKLEEELKRKKEEKRKRKRAKYGEVGRSGKNENPPRAEYIVKNTMKAHSESRQLNGVTGENVLQKNKAFLKRSGTTDKGKFYENMVTANVMLQMATNDTIKNFYISSNDANYGAFDDVVIEIHTDEGVQTKALQLKLCNRGSLVLQRLASKKGDFSLLKYFESLREIQQKPDQYVLLTNLKFNTSAETKFQLEGEEFFLKPVKLTISDRNLKIPRNVDCCYKFEIFENEWTKHNLSKIRQFQIFLEHFYLYDNQDNLETLEKSTMNEFTQRFSSDEDTFRKYVRTIWDWGMREGKKQMLDKKMTQRIIALRLLSPKVEPLVFGSVSAKMKILRNAMGQFHITLLEKNDYQRVKQLWGDFDKRNLDVKELNRLNNIYQLSSKNIQKVEDVDDVVITQFLWLMDECPLIVTDHDGMKEAIKLCRDRRFVILGGAKCRNWMKSHSVFENLFDLKKNLELYESVIENFTVSLQGKEELNLKTVFTNEEFFKSVTTNDLLEMLNGPRYIDGRLENLPNPYIERDLSLNIVDIRFLRHPRDDTTIIFNCNLCLDEVDGHYHMIIDIDEFSVLSDVDHSNDSRIIIISKDNYTEEQFQRVYCKTPEGRVVHCFKFIDKKSLKWIRSKGDVSRVKIYKLPNSPVKEKAFFSFEYNGSLNVITGDPGMGKTELTKSLKNNCPSKYWAVIINPMDVNTIFKNVQKCERSGYLSLFETFMWNEKLQYLDRLDQDIYRMCFLENRVLYIWDALDEVLPTHLEAVSDLILMLSEKNFLQCVTCRQHLKSYLEEKFSTLPLSLNQFSHFEQKDYIRTRLDNVDMVTTIEKIKSTFAVIQHVDVLAVPLQIYMVTEIIRQSDTKYLELLNNSFLLTDLYSHFIDGKFNFFYGHKVPVQHPHFEYLVNKEKTKKIQEYQRLAAEAVFYKGITGPNTDLQNDIDSASEDCATIGIITGLTEGTPQFAHASFAEYLAALYLYNNRDKVPKYWFFTQKCSNVRFFFDMLVGKNSPAHIAILYRNFESLEKYSETALRCKDDLGRSALHLICSWGRRYPRLDARYSNTISTTHVSFEEKVETEVYLQAVRHLLDKCDLSEKDTLFEMTPLSWSQRTESLGAELELLQSRKLQIESYRKNDVINILYYSVVFGYCDVFELFASGNSRHFYNDIATESACTLLILASLNGHKTIVEHLVKSGADINRSDEKRRTSLYVASKRGHEEVVDYLVKSGAIVNLPDNQQQTPLCVASEKGHDKIVERLLTSEVGTNDDNSQRSRLIVSMFKPEKILEFFVEPWKAKPNRAMWDGITPLHMASKIGNLKIVNCLVKSGAEVNQAGRYGETPLYTASLHGHEKVVAYLMESGGDVDHPTRSGRTPLFAAALNGHEEILALLVQSGAEIDRADADSVTPLSAASESSNEKIVDLLVKSGADVNRPDADGQTPLQVACSRAYETLMVRCMTFVEDEDRLNMRPFSDPLRKSYRQLNDLYAKSRYEDARTDLVAASRKAQEEIVVRLVEAGADIDGADKCGRTPLFRAAADGRGKIVEYLVRSGAQIDRADDNGRTPLYIASAHDYEEIVDCLVKAGADINRADKNDETPVLVAWKNGHKKIVDYLKESGADVSQLQCS